jgi:hypothetical protein
MVVGFLQIKLVEIDKQNVHPKKTQFVKAMIEI